MSSPTLPTPKRTSNSRNFWFESALIGEVYTARVWWRIASAIAYSATAVLPAEVCAATKTFSPRSRWTTARFWNTSSSNGQRSAGAGTTSSKSLTSLVSSTAHSAVAAAAGASGARGAGATAGSTATSRQPKAPGASRSSSKSGGSANSSAVQGSGGSPTLPCSHDGSAVDGGSC